MPHEPVTGRAGGKRPGLSPWGIGLWAASSLAVLLTFVFRSPVMAYHPDVPNAGIDAGIFMSYQVLFLALVLTGRRHLGDFLLNLAPVVALLAYSGSWANHAAIFLFEVLDGPYLGADSQDVLFDKQNIACSLLFVTAAILFAERLRPRLRTWDRSFLFFMSFALATIVVAYHSVIYGTVWPAVSAPYHDAIASFEAEVLAGGIPDACPVAPDLSCHIFPISEPFPTDPAFTGNPVLGALAATDPAGLPHHANLLQSSVDDTYLPMYVGRGFFVSQGERAMIWYSRMETPWFILMANAIGSLVAAFVFAWMAAGLSLSVLHARLDRGRAGEGSA